MKSHKNINKYYDQDWLNGVGSKEYRALFKLLKKELPKESPKSIKVLDMAGGSGKLSILLKKIGYEAYLHDQASQLVEVAIENRLKKDHAFVSDIFKIPKKYKKSFDVVIIKSSTHEFPKKKMPSVYGAVKKLLLPNGIFFDWDAHLPDKNSAKWLKKLANIKDTVAGLDMLVKNRYFYTEKEVTSSLKDLDYKNIKIAYRFHYTLSMKNWTMAYWGGDEKKTLLFMSKIEKLINNAPASIQVKRGKNDVIIKIPAVIISAVK